jgi:hypothetical protein
MLLINEDKKFVINLIVRRCSKEVIAEILKMEFEDFK